MLGVVVAAGLADPPGGLVGRLREAVPVLEHPASGRRSPGPRRPPTAGPAWPEERGVQRVDVDVVALVGAGADPLELGLGLGQPRAEVGDDVADGPVRVARSSRARGTPRASATGRGRRARTSRAARPRSRRRTGGRAAVAGVATRRRSWRRHERALERQPGVLPVEQPAGVAPDVAIAAPDEVAVQGDAREAVDVRAVDDDLVVGLDRRVQLVGRVEMERARDVLGVERPAVEGHDQLEVVAAIELRLELVAADRPDRLDAERGVRVRLVHDRRASSRIPGDNHG